MIVRYEEDLVAAAVHAERDRRINQMWVALEDGVEELEQFQAFLKANPPKPKHKGRSFRQRFFRF